MKTALAAFLIATVAATAPQTAFANGSATLTSTIKVKFRGITLGLMKNAVSVSGSRYSISGKVRTKGLANVVAKTDASFSSAGGMSGTRLSPSKQSVSWKSRRDRGATSIAFSGGNVTSASVNPAPKPKPDRVPLKGNHKRGVLDPVSTLVFTVAAGDVGNGRAICNRTLPIFDGANRYNLRFSYKGSGSGKARGFSGKTFTCAVRYQPIAGHRSQRKSTKRLAAQRDMQVTMARIGNTNAYSLFGFRVRTSRGVATGRATAFEAR